MTRINKDTISSEDLLKQIVEMLINQGPDALMDMFQMLFNYSMRLERDAFLKAKPWQRND
ncbi:MAG: type VI secretion system contractile sheath protein TssC [Fibrobacter sp.]|nr:type VI secretion system contractile sheath protein TssC [Fibrobacter sp.]